MEIGEIKRAKDIGKKGTNRFIWQACAGCGKERWVRFNTKENVPTNFRCITCVLAKRNTNHSGNKSFRWKGGRSKDSHTGYILVWLTKDDFFYPMAHKKNKSKTAAQVAEHRLVMAKHLGRCLQSFELVHHKNGIRDDNRIENLELSDTANHIKNHRKGYEDGYQKGLIDGRNKQIEELRQEIKLLQWQMREVRGNTKSVS